MRLPTTTFASVTPAFVSASSTAFWISACVSSLVASNALTAASTTTFASATFSASDFGNFPIVLSKSILSVAVPQFIETTAFTLPDAFEVAAFKSKSPTVAVTSVILAAANASAMTF